MNIKQNILQTVGKTPLIKLNRITKGIKSNIFVKAEFFNPGGSVKDRIGLNMIECAEREGLLKDGGTIIEATAGNTGIGLALAAAIKGYRCIFVLPDKMSADKISLIKAYGAEVVITPTSVAPDSPESYNGVAERLKSEIPGAFRPDQFSNPNNPHSHYCTTGPEIWEDTDGNIDAFVAGIGTGGTITGTSKYLKEKNPKIKIVGADPEGSIYSGDSPKPYKVEGIGEDFIPRTFDRQLIDVLIRISDKESFNTARRLAREEGILAGGSSGTALAAALKYAEGLNHKENIVVLLPDTGRNYITKIYCDEWMQQNGFWEGKVRERITVGQIIAGKTDLPMMLCLSPENTVSEAVSLIRKYNISQVPIIENDKSVGCLQEATLMKLAWDGVDFKNQKIRAVMGKPLSEISTDTEVSEAYRILLSGSSALIVVDSGKPITVLTRIDLMDLSRWRHD